MNKAHLDFETASPQDLGKGGNVGVYRYAEDPATRIWGFCWSIDSLPGVHQWRPGYPDPTVFLEHVARGGIVVSHNASFERVIWNKVLIPRYAPHWPALRIEQQDCTMSRALALSLPADLQSLGAVLGTVQQKDDVGHKLMLKLSRPRGVNAEGVYYWWDAPDFIEGLMSYCEQDVRTEAEIDKKLAPLSAVELEVWRLDQRINDRGTPVDVNICTRAEGLVEQAKRQADAEMRRITEQYVGGVSKVVDLIAWVSSQGVECSSVAKGEIPSLIARAEAGGKSRVVNALKLRQEASKTSTAKFKKINACVCSGGRLHGLLAYWGARTGRWAGRLVQPQNFPRFDQENAGEAEAVSLLVGMLAEEGMPLARILKDFTPKYGIVLPWMSKALRSVISAPKGKKFIGGDFSNIEGRKNAWLAGEEWKIQAFRDYDAGTGEDLYRLAYAKSFGVEVRSVTKAQRQIGKVQELALGYQGSVMAFISMGANYGVNPGEIANAVNSVTPASQWEATEFRYEKAKNKSGLQIREWTALQIVVDNWRASNSKIVQSWWDYQGAALAAIDAPGLIGYVRGGAIPVAYVSDGGYLYCRLPSGRVICYAQPSIQEAIVSRVNRKGEEFQAVDRRITFYGTDSLTRSWSEQYLYGGLLCENVCQASARDHMVYAMLAAEAAGYEIILTVHDELLAEVPAGFGSPEEFDRIMSLPQKWAPGMPLATKTWTDTRYVK